MKVIFENYYLRRLLPFAVVFFGLEAIEVLATFFWDFSKVDTDALSLAQTIFNVFWQTSVAFAYAILPFLLFLFCLPRKWHYGKTDKIVSLIIFIIFTLVCTFTEVSELFFWDEFRSRFNFIAVDYLVYTNEVVGNIWQSYPMVPILSGIVIVATVVAAIVWKKFSFKTHVPAWYVRASILVGTLAFCALAFSLLDNSQVEGSGNRYNDELGKNGFYSLFSAFLKNELPWDEFYPTLSQDELTRRMRKEFDSAGTQFVGADNEIRRHVPAKKTEKKLNVMLVVMESFGSEFMNEETAPNLSRLAKEGLYFSNTYATGTRSVRGLEAVSLAIPPLPGMSVVRRDGNENLETAGTFFAQKGYKNRWIYGGYGVFDNMNYYFENNGFEVCDRSSMAEDEISFTTIWGVCDEDLFKRAIREANKSHAKNEPFFNFVFTTSNHRPYAYPDGKIDIPSKTGRKGAVKYADFAVGELVRLAREQPWFDDTIFVFVADHCSSCAGRKELNPEKHKIPLIFWSPKNIVPARKDFVVSQIDALPTLLGLLGFDYETSFYGKDALAPDYRSRAFISNYQHVGFLKDDALVVMKPVKEILIYRGNAETPENYTAENAPEIVHEAAAYYQHAENWRQFLKNRD